MVYISNDLTVCPPVHIAPFLFKRIVLIEKMIFPVAAFVFTAAYAESRNACRDCGCKEYCYLFHNVIFH